MTRGEKFLITGGAGFIGSNFIRHLYRKYPAYRIVNYDLLTYAGNLDNLSDIDREEKLLIPERRRYQFVRGDICDKEKLEELLASRKFDVVVNFAAESHVDRSIVQSAHFVRTNVQGTHTLIDLVRRHKTPLFVQISTDETYGDMPRGVSLEDSPLRPSNPYSASKAAADLLVQAYVRTHKIPALVVRGSNNFGPYQYPEKLIPLTISNLLEGKQIPVHGKGQHVRSWIHVLDFCQAIDILVHSGKLGIYNVSGEEKRNIEVIEAVARFLGKDLSKFISYTDDRPGGDSRYAPDSSKIRREFGWQPSYSINNALAPLVQWYRNNSEWWEKIKSKPEYVYHYEKQSKAQYY